MNKKNGLSAYRQRKVIDAFCADLTATQAATVLNLNRNTVNRYYRIFREAIRDHQRRRMEMFRGVAEVSECYFGAVRKRGDPGSRVRLRGSSKQPVFGVIERGGEVFTEIIPDAKKKTLQALIRGKVSREATIMSVGWVGCDGLVDVGYDAHLRIEKAVRPREGKPPFADGPVHIEECEWRWRKDHATLIDQLKRLIVWRLPVFATIVNPAPET